MKAEEGEDAEPKEETDGQPEEGAEGETEAAKEEGEEVVKLRSVGRNNYKCYSLRKKQRWHGPV